VTKEPDFKETPTTTPVDDPTRWIPRKEAAEIVGVSISAIRKYEREGKLGWCKEANGEVVIDAQGAERMADERGGDLSQRHLEAIYKSRLAVVEDLRVVIEEQRTEATRKDARITELETRSQEEHALRAKLLREKEDLEGMRHDRELEIQTHEREQERKDRLVQGLTPIAGAIASKLGVPVGLLPTGSPAAAALGRLRDGLTQEQASQLQAILTTDQQMDLVTVLEGTTKEKPK